MAAAAGIGQSYLFLHHLYFWDRCGDISTHLQSKDAGENTITQNDDYQCLVIKFTNQDDKKKFIEWITNELPKISKPSIETWEYDVFVPYVDSGEIFLISRNQVFYNSNGPLSKYLNIDPNYLTLHEQHKMLNLAKSAAESTLLKPELFVLIKYSYDEKKDDLDMYLKPLFTSKDTISISIVAIPLEKPAGEQKKLDESSIIAISPNKFAIAQKISDELAKTPAQKFLRLGIIHRLDGSNLIVQIVLMYEKIKIDTHTIPFLCELNSPLSEVLNPKLSKFKSEQLSSDIPSPKLISKTATFQKYCFAVEPVLFDIYQKVPATFTKIVSDAIELAIKACEIQFKIPDAGAKPDDKISKPKDASFPRIATFNTVNSFLFAPDKSSSAIIKKILEFTLQDVAVVFVLTDPNSESNHILAIYCKNEVKFKLPASDDGLDDFRELAEQDNKIIVNISALVKPDASLTWKIATIKQSKKIIRFEINKVIPEIPLEDKKVPAAAKPSRLSLVDDILNRNLLRLQFQPNIVAIVLEEQPNQEKISEFFYEVLQKNIAAELSKLGLAVILEPKQPEAAATTAPSLTVASSP